MQHPRLRPRPMSTKICTNFRGLDRRAGASVRHDYQSWAISWKDERNLSADRAPMLSVRKGKIPANDVDGYPGVARITAVNVQGDNLVILDETGLLWCNGHELSLNNSLLGTLETRIETVRGTATLTQTDRELMYTFGAIAAEWAETHGVNRSNAIRVTLCYDGDGNVYLYDEQTREESEDAYSIAEDMGCTLTGTAQQGDLFRYTQIQTADPDDLKNMTQMVTMGALTCICGAAGGMGLWVNTVDLAAGRTMILGQNYGSMGGKTQWIAGDITLKLCDVDGNPYTGVVVSASEPAQPGLWLETGREKTVLHEWRSYTSEWIAVDKTYVRIKLEDVTYRNNVPRIYDALQTPPPHLFKAGDTVRLSCKNYPVVDYNDAWQILNGTHYVQAVVDGDIVVAGILDDTERLVGLLNRALVPGADGVPDSDGYVQAERVLPQMDYVVESGNRLWGCCYGVQDGKTINEIFCSKLGDPTNWESYQGLSTDAWRASRGIAEPYTGAAVLGNCPLFFREDSLEKVYPSSSGAHQVQTFTLEGVENGAAGSLCVIEDRLYYKSREGAMVYAGSQPRRISDAWGDLRLIGGSAARHGRKYCLSTVNADGEGLVAVYDTETGDWHLETDSWDGKAVTLGDDLYYLSAGELFRRYGLNGAGVEWYAETDTVAFVPEHTWIYYLRFRFRLVYRQNATVRVYIAYGDLPFELKGTLYGHMMDTQEISIFPERKDNFRIRLEGSGDCELQSLSFRVERSEGGH